MTPALENHLLQSTVFACLAGVLTLLLRNNEARTRYWVWFVASMKFLVPFSVFVELGHRLAWSSAPMITQPQMAFVVNEISRPFAAANLYATPVAASSLLPEALFAIWMIGCVAVLAYWLARWRRVATILRAGVPLQEGREPSSLHRVDSEDSNIRLVSSSGQIEPGVFGVLRPVLSLPVGVAKYLDDDQLDAILTHEVCHVRRRDNLTAAMHMLVEAAFWFHPLVWWLGARLVEERERACDEEVVRLGRDPEVYAEGILKICRLYLETPLVCVSGVTGADLRKRIEIIMTGRAVRRLNLSKKAILAVAGFTAMALPVIVGIAHTPAILAQTPSSARAPAQFEVASVKRHPTEDSSGGIAPHPGRFDAIGVPLKLLIQIAYGLKDHQVLGGPGWIDSERYDVFAKAADGTNPSRKEMQPMLQALLAERFGLKTHRETRELPAFGLLVAKGGPKLAQHHPKPPGIAGDEHPFSDKGSGPMVSEGHGVLMAQQTNMQGLAYALGVQSGREVIDRTGLGGDFDFTLKWNPEMAEQDPAAVSLFTAIQEQLGLKLESTKAPVDVLVIDGVKRPSAN
jgi:bla regulator protein BlaR1